MLREYTPLVLLMGFVAANTAGMLVFSHLVSPQRPTSVKSMPYESGVTPLGGTRDRFSVKFYLVAMLFIVFDLETVFMIPWGVAFRQLGILGLAEMVVFVLILMVGYIYVWKRGAFQWD
ncbi:MAG: NADH-quinone oxidoreductase subunit A [Gemmatimonadales bacterium]